MIIPAFRTFVPFPGIMAAASGTGGGAGGAPAILGTPVQLWNAVASTSHTYSYTVAGANGLIVIAYGNNGQTFTSCTWGAQAMTALPMQSNGNTRCQIFHLYNPTAGAGTITVVSSTSPMGILPISISGWSGTAPVQAGQNGAVGTNIPPLSLNGVQSNSLIIHGVATSNALTVTVSWDASETELIDAINPGTAVVRMGAAWKQSVAGGTVTVDAATSTTDGRWCDVAAAFPPVPPPSIYYVDASATGNDSANGLSPSTPWKTIAKVNSSTFQPGDSILFAGGQTFTGGLVFTATSWNRTAAATNPVTIGSYGTGRATISSGTTYGFISADLGGFHLRDLIFTGTSTASIHGVMIWNSESGTGKIQYVRVTNLLIQGYGNHGFLLYGGFATSSTAGFNDVIIDGVVATANTGAAGQASTAGISVIGRYGFNLDQGNPTHTNITIRNCVSHGNTGRAGMPKWTGSGIVAASGVQNCLIEYCVAYNNGVNSNSSGGPVGFMSYDSNLVTIQYCESYDNKTGPNQADGGGFDLDGGMRNSVIQYCYSHSNAGPGFMLFAYAEVDAVSATGWTTNTIRYCISQNDAVGRTGWSAAGLVIAKFDATMANARAYNNTIYSNSTGAAVCYVGPQGTGTISGTVANNIFYSSNGAYVVDTETYNPTTSVAFKGNDYYAAGTFRIRWNGVTYSGVAATAFANWKSAQGQETAPGAGLTSNPLLTTPGGGGTLNGYVAGQPAAYKLQSGSPMIGAGLNMLTQLSIDPGTKDFFGTTIPVSGTFDVGAHEFV